jgi:EmrB/QacA subfamily drug resistance transporter
MVAACLALFAIFLDNTVVNVALPTIQADLAATPERLEWIVNAYVVAFAGLVLLGGSLGDRFGRRHVFRLALVGFALASALGAMATTDGMLIAARALQGAAAAALAPLSLSLLAEAFPRDRLPAAVGMWAGVSGLGLAVGPLVGGLAVAWFGWHSIFWINVPIALAAAACARTASSRVVGRPVDAVGSILATAALVCLVTGLSLTVRHPWTGPNVLVLLSAGAVLAGGFVVHQRRAEFPLVSGSALNPGRFRSAGAAVALTSFGLFGTLWYLSLYLQNIAGYTPVEAGVRTLPLTVTTLVVAPLAGKLTARRGPGPGLLLAVAALIGLARLDAAASYPFLAGCLFVYGVGLALSLPTAVGVMVADADSERVGTASAVATMTRQLGGALGLAVLATIGARTAVAAVHLPPEAAAAPGVGDLVAGARVDIIAQLAGEPARVAAADAFLHGFRVVMLVAAAITALALLAALPLLHWPPASGHRPPAGRRPGTAPSAPESSADRHGWRRGRPSWLPSCTRSGLSARPR